MNELWYVVVLTLPAYITPLIWSFVRNGAVAASFFFAYSFFGTWLFSFLLASGLISAEDVIAPWVISPHNFAWYSFACINLLVFFLQLFGNGKRATAERQARPKRVQLLAVATVCLILLYILSSIVLNGGVAAWIENAYRRVAVENSVINYMFPIATFTLVATVALYAILRKVNLSKSTRCAILGACVLQGLVALASGGRSVLLLYIVSLVIAHGKAKLPRWLIYGSTAVIVIAFSGAMIYERYQKQEAVASFTFNLKNIVAASYTGLPYIDHFDLARDYVERKGHNFGKSYASLVTLPVPRALWSNKPIQLSRLFRYEYWGDSTGGIPPGMFGEAYVAFGWFGVLVIGACFGWLMNLLSKRYPVNGGSYSTSVVAVIGSAIGFILVRGGLDIGIYRVGLIVVSLWIITKFLYLPEKRVSV